jgi:osmotically-inducible protein OsmY
MHSSRLRRLRLIASALVAASILWSCAAFERPDARDARITAQVKTLLAENGGLQAPNQIDVQSRNGVVYLHGLVDTPYEQAQAALLARQVPGVSRVENLIAVSDAR